MISPIDFKLKNLSFRNVFNNKLLHFWICSLAWKIADLPNEETKENTEMKIEF